MEGVVDTAVWTTQKQVRGNVKAKKIVQGIYRSYVNNNYKLGG